MKIIRRSDRFFVERAGERAFAQQRCDQTFAQRWSDPTFAQRHSRRFLNNREGFHMRDDRGSVESALTLIPLMILFLTVTQVGIAVYSRSAYDQVTQGATAYRAFGGTPSDSAASPSPQSSFTNPLIALPLPGGGSILVGEQSVKLPGITPLLPSGDAFNSTGIAVQE